MMDQNLIAKYFRGECTDEELSQIQKYVNDEDWAMEELGNIWHATDTHPSYREEDKFRNLKQIREKTKYKQFESKL